MTIRKPACIALLVVAALAGCAQIIGFPDYGTGGAGGTGGAAASTTTSSTTTSTTSTGTSSSSSNTGTGGGDAGCVNGAPCYDGPAGTEGVGACHGSTLSCDADGGTCAGEVLPTVERCTTPDVDENCDGIAACTGQFRWAATLPGATTGDFVAAGADGTVAVVGTPGPNSGIAVVDAFDPHGRSCWSAPATLGAGTVTPRAVALAGAGPASATVSCPAGGLVASTVVVGQVSGPVSFGQGPVLTPKGNLDSFVALVDPAGKVAWGEIFGSGGADGALGVTASADGYLYVTGSTAGTLDLACTQTLDGGTATDPGVFVAKLAIADGSCVWAQVWPGPGARTQGTGVAIDAAGNVDVVGTFASTLNVGGQQFMATGTNNTFVVRLGTDGTYSGAVTYMADNTQPVRIAAAPASQRVYVSGTVANGLSSATLGGLCGSVQGQQAYFVTIGPGLQTVPSGYVCYSTGYADAGGDTIGLGAAVDTAGNAVVALGGSGDIQDAQQPFSTPLFAQGLVVLKFVPPPPYGEYLWQSPVSTTPGISSAALAVDGLGNVVIAGTGSGTLDLGGTTLDAGASSGFVVELAP
jgi:hypothetical protein